MMIGEKARLIPSIEVPPWDPLDDSRTRSPFSITSPSVIRNGNAGNGDPVLDYIRTMHRYLTSNEFAGVESDPPDTEEFDMAVDAFSCDHFRMFEFKVRKCARARSHDWTDCPYAHPAEKARRRDPRKYHYSGTACPEFRKGICKKGDACEFAHGIFECWLHPTRYRTQPCKDGLGCRRRVCFFAHSPEQLRVLSQQSPGSLGSGDSFDGSPPRQTHRHAFESYLEKMAMVSSPPLSPSSPSVPPNSAEHGCHCGSVYNFTPSCRLVALMRDLHLDKTKMNPQWNVQMDPGCGSTIRTGFNSMPSTPTRTSTLSGLGAVDHWSIGAEEEHAMERVESGKYLRDKIYAELSRDNSVGQGRNSAVSAPDVGWVSELVK